MQRTEKEPTGSICFFPARWKFRFRSHRSQTFGQSRKKYEASSSLIVFDGIFGEEENDLGEAIFPFVNGRCHF